MHATVGPPNSGNPNSTSILYFQTALDPFGQCEHLTGTLPHGFIWVGVLVGPYENLLSLAQVIFTKLTPIDPLFMQRIHQHWGLGLRQSPHGSLKWSTVVS